MINLANDLVLRVARGETVERPPVWLMRQAGRYLTEYQEVRKKAGGFRQMVNTPEIAAEITLQPVDLIGVDAAIIFSDILVVPEAMGLPYQMVEKTGPYFEEKIQNISDLRRLHPVGDSSNLDHTYQALRIVKKALHGRVPLIGFAGAPWTIFSYMTEGGGSKTFSLAKSLLYKDPEFSHALLSQITEATIQYLKGQIAAGADILQLFDSWAGVLDVATYRSFSLPYLHKICSAIQEVPLIVFAKGAFFALEDLGKLDCAVIGLDWHTTPDFALQYIHKQALQGNMDPCALYGLPEQVAEKTLEMIASFPHGRYIANLGHGLYPDIPRESVLAFVETVKSYRYPV